MKSAGANAERRRRAGAMKSLVQAGSQGQQGIWVKRYTVWRTHAMGSGKTEQIHREKRAPGETEPPTSCRAAPGEGQATSTRSTNPALR